ncbi:MAG: DUF1080 domain-containing protein, partial [Zavarzinella sp.]|nr:DUF1080 domain-containing protein [Zavarzinella sp.]
KAVTVTRNGDKATITLARGGPYGLQVRLGDRELQTSDARVRIGGELVRVRVEDRPSEPVPIPPAADPFAAGSVWRGTKMYERGAYAGLTVFYELRVYSRDGDSFTGQNFDNGPDRNPCAVTGTIRGDDFTWTEVAQFNPNHKVEMHGTRTGTVLNLTFQGTINEGRATLYRVHRPGEPKADDFVPIFDGRSLAGWETHPDQRDGWTVNGYGKLVGSGAAVSHLYTRRDDYRDVHVKIRAMVRDGGPSGVLVRSGFGPSAGRSDPDAYRALIYTGPEAMKTGGLYLPGVAKPEPRRQPTRAGPTEKEWFDLDVIAVGPTVRVLVNGEETARADGQAARPGGRIALQLHDAKTAVEFASVAVKELSR